MKKLNYVKPQIRVLAIECELLADSEPQNPPKKLYIPIEENGERDENWVAQ